MLSVVAGTLDCEGRRVGEGSALIIEAEVPTVVRSFGHAPVIHLGTIATEAPVTGIFGPPVRDGRRVHSERPEQASPIRFSGGDGAISFYFSDGTCPTCRVTLFLYDGSVFTHGYSGASHFHAQDEIIHILEGELHFGPLTARPGTSVAVPRGVRYSFGTSGPFRYLDSRADVATAVVAPGSEPVLETVDSLLRLGGGGSGRRTPVPLPRA